MKPVSTAHLRQFKLLEDLPEDLLQWIIDCSWYEEVKDGQVWVRKGDPIDDMIFMLEGGEEFFLYVNGVRMPIPIVFKDKEITGVLPYSRMEKSIGDAFAKGDTKMLHLHKSHFPELIQKSPELVKRLVSTMVDRARFFKENDLQYEKMHSLGKLSAGLAHELNNPAAAALRTANELKKCVDVQPKIIQSLIKANISAELIDKATAFISAKTENKKRRSLMEKEEMEERWLEKLSELNLKKPHIVAESLVEADIAAGELDDVLGDNATATVYIWIANLISCSLLIDELKAAGHRISDLVNAVKYYTHMDRSLDAKPVDVHQGIDNSIIILNHKIKKKSIKIEKKFAHDLPPAHAFPGEMNQVWMNLIDNAIDAVETGGTIEISTWESFRDQSFVNAKIRDNGKGIPDDLKEKIWEMFYSTKNIGEGTGLGLSVVKQILDKSNAAINLSSEPGNTEFTVCIPACKKEVAAGK